MNDDNLKMKQNLSYNELYLLKSEMEQERKSLGIAFLLWFFLGTFGGHRFYLGDIGYGVAMLLLGWLTFWIWPLVDAFFIPKNIREYNAHKEREIIQKIINKSYSSPQSFYVEEKSKNMEVEYGSFSQNSYLTAPIKDMPGERGYNKYFRRIGDDENVFRINQPQPKGTPKKVAEYIHIAGISKYTDNVQKFVSGVKMKLSLERDPNNPYDKNAIRVYGTSVLKGKESRSLLGYIPNTQTEHLAKYSTLNATIKTIFFPTNTKSFGFRIDIWSKRKDQQS